MNEMNLELYWSEIPIGKSNAVNYDDLKAMWGRNERDIRKILHDLSAHDNGDDYILIRSSKQGGGFYKTQNRTEIEEYRAECLNKGKSIFAPVKKINRVLKSDAEQFSFTNNLRVRREAAGLKQTAVCDAMKLYDTAFDVPMLSKMENGVCLPTYTQCKLLALIYDCDPSDLIRYDFYGGSI